MADKHLTESHWKTATKGKDLAADGDVLKALALVARAEKAKPDAAGLAAQRDALSLLDKALAGFQKTNAKVLRADKALVGLMADMTAATERTRKALETQAKALDKAKANADEDEDEEEAPDLLTTRMVPLLRQVRQGNPMHTKLALAGREMVVMLSRKAIAPARKVLMVTMLEQKNGVKVIDGTCVLENKFVTFVLNNSASGLAKRISAALLKQTGMRVPVRVRGPDGDLDEDDEDEGSKDAPAPSKDGGKAGVQVGRFVNHARSRLAWQKVRQKVQADLQGLERAIVSYCATQPDLSKDAVAKVRKLDGILKTLDESLSDTLDRALNAPDDKQRLALHEESRKVLAGYIQFVKSDALLAGVDKNPFVPLKTREFLVTSLQALDKSLA